ncbi:heavy-metal-associated domain-containing protein [Nocardia sp. NPDC003963]
MSTSRFTVTGMTRGGCAASLRGELGRIPGVTSVTVDLGTGTADLRGTLPIDSAAIAAAVSSGAGYAVAE